MKKSKPKSNIVHFYFKVNGHIIQHESFLVKNYNEECKNSLEIREMMDEIIGTNNQLKLGVIPQYLKNRCIGLIWDCYNPNYTQSRVNKKNIYDKEDFYTFEVITRNENIVVGGFSGAEFQTGARYQIDISNEIDEIKQIIKNYLTLDTYTKKYNNIELELR